ncbi:hypothetical protein [Mycoplasma zalophidermidis]|uniref:hypothetical protein n=1 Tax=Mycoplasma zalophidermidis TaxID=398174 RepID=UPI001FEC017B|nr:hypothetical protein [Mycoplasma zalophidermidis]
MSNRREGDPDYLVADSTKIAEEMNFHVQFDIEDIAKSEFEWRREVINKLNK